MVITKVISLIRNILLPDLAACINQHFVGLDAGALSIPERQAVRTPPVPPVDVVSTKRSGQWMVYDELPITLRRAQVWIR